MKVYYNNSQGCGIWFFVIIVLMFMMMGAFFKFLFTTPVGLVLLILGIIYYWVRKYQSRNNQYVDPGQTKEEYSGWNESTGEPVSRDADDVVFYDADDDSKE